MTTPAQAEAAEVANPLAPVQGQVMSAEEEIGHAAPDTQPGPVDIFSPAPPPADVADAQHRVMPTEEKPTPSPSPVPSPVSTPAMPTGPRTQPVIRQTRKPSQTQGNTTNNTVRRKKKRGFFSALVHCFAPAYVEEPSRPQSALAPSVPPKPASPLQKTEESSHTTPPATTHVSETLLAQQEGSGGPLPTVPEIQVQPPSTPTLSTSGAAGVTGEEKVVLAEPITSIGAEPQDRMPAPEVGAAAVAVEPLYPADKVASPPGDELYASEEAAVNEPSVVSLPESVEQQQWLLAPLRPEHKGKKCLVLDLDETLVHSSFKLIHQADFIVPVDIEGQLHDVYVIKRPGVDAFMKKMGEMYEIVVFTASLSKYADPVLDMLDIHGVVHHRLFRESCFNHQGNYVKDLSQLGRDLRDVIILDNSPASYIFHPSHAVPISSWFNDMHDTELVDLIPFLEDLTGVGDVGQVLDVSL
ncbi:hypothetical protein YB2330_005173 [Saitoella coloradoensis]